MIVEFAPEVFVSKRNCVPGHVLEVFLEVVLRSVPADKDQLKLVLGMVVVEGSKGRGEASAWRALQWLGTGMATHSSAQSLSKQTLHKIIVLKGNYLNFSTSVTSAIIMY